MFVADSWDCCSDPSCLITFDVVSLSVVYLWVSDRPVMRFKSCQYRLLHRLSEKYTYSELILMSRSLFFLHQRRQLKGRIEKERKNKNKAQKPLSLQKETEKRKRRPGCFLIDCCMTDSRRKTIRPFITERRLCVDLQRVAW